MPHDLAEALTECARQLSWSGPRIIARPEGNRDRRPEDRREHLIVEVPDKGTFKLTIGADLAAVHDSHEALATAFPGLIPRPVAFVSAHDRDILVQEAVAGESLESCIGNLATLTSVLPAWSTLVRTLTHSRRPSTSAAWQTEWALWAERFSALPIWVAHERPALAALLEELREHLEEETGDTPATAWTNGDFTTNNILIGTDGRPQLLDAEFAAATHFYAEDHARLAALSPTFAAHPGLLGLFAQAPSAAVQLFFQLRQLWLECRQNSPAYCERIALPRKAAILEQRSHRVHAADPNVAIPQHACTDSQLFLPTPAGWNESCSRRLRILTGKRQLVCFPLRSLIGQIRWDPWASSENGILHSLRIVTASGRNLDALPQIQSPNITLKKLPDGSLQLGPKDNDPQLLVTLPEEATWLAAELEVSSTTIPSPSPC